MSGARKGSQRPPPSGCGSVRSVDQQFFQAVVQFPGPCSLHPWARYWTSIHSRCCSISVWMMSRCYSAGWPLLSVYVSMSLNGCWQWVLTCSVKCFQWSSWLEKQHINAVQDPSVCMWPLVPYLPDRELWVTLRTLHHYYFNRNMSYCTYVPYLDMMHTLMNFSFFLWV